MTAVMPIVTVDDLEGVLAYYRDTLGFNEDFKMSITGGPLHTIGVSLGDAGLMFVAAIPGSPAPTALNPEGLAIFISVENVDAYHDSVAGKDGVTVAEGLTDQFWGDRTFIVRDPWGLHLWFGQTTGQMSAPPEGMEVSMAQPVG